MTDEARLAIAWTALEFITRANGLCRLCEQRPCPSYCDAGRALALMGERPLIAPNPDPTWIPSTGICRMCLGHIKIDDAKPYRGACVRCGTEVAVGDMRDFVLARAEPNEGEK